MEQNKNYESEAGLELQRRIEFYLKRSGTPATRFGREALGDPGFVTGLRNGREPRPRTIQRIADFLDGAESKLRSGRDEPRVRTHYPQ